MKLEAKEFDGSNHKKLVTEAGKDIGLLYLDVNGYYYYEPNEGKGTFSAYHLRLIADLLDEVNKPFDNKVKEYFKKGRKSPIKIGDKVIVKNRGYHYSTYSLKFKELGFKKPKEAKAFPPTFDEDEVFTVFRVGSHQNGTMLYAIVDEEGNEYLFNKKGLKILSNDGEE